MKLKTAMTFDEVADDRPSIAGHPLPWSIVPVPPMPPMRPFPGEDEEVSESEYAYLVDGDGYQVLRFYIDQPEGRLLKALVMHFSEPGQTMAELAPSESAIKVAKLRHENDRAEGRRVMLAAQRHAFGATLPKGSSVDLPAPDSLRISALEAGLLKVFHLFDQVTVEAPGKVRDFATAHYRLVETIIYDLGLSHRIWDDETEPEQATA